MISPGEKGIFHLICRVFKKKKSQPGLNLYPWHAPWYHGLVKAEKEEAEYSPSDPMPKVPIVVNHPRCHIIVGPAFLPYLRRIPLDSASKTSTAETMATIKFFLWSTANKSSTNSSQTPNRQTSHHDQNKVTSRQGQRKTTWRLGDRALLRKIASLKQAW